MKIFKLSGLFSLACALCAAMTLFWVSQSVQQAERERLELQRDIVREQQTIRVLRAEWDYLNRPERLESLARENLGMDLPPLSSVEEDARFLSVPENEEMTGAPIVHKTGGATNE